ncbi:hypothetical protein V5O48_004034 [Marasmius crinis-equi]|uniref:Uncharacterized protein n=1 Tax=Marasmius crinis-equi TaxID=585013 RepID=A0ABR3FR67_9AGAR
MPPKRRSSSSPSPSPSTSATKKRRIFTSTVAATTTTLPNIHQLCSLPSTPGSPTIARGYKYSFPDTPSNSSPSTSPSLATTPYPLAPYDSPSNPFGRRRSLVVMLPPQTSFRRHVPLRFQFIHSGSGAKWKGGGVYRVVQVPLSYTFRHLRILISWLFGGWGGADFGLGIDHKEGCEQDEDEELFGTGGDRAERNKPSNGKEKGRGHLFEVRKIIEMWASSHRAGVIKRSTTKIRLSSVLDPYQFKEKWDEEKDEEVHVWQDKDDDPDVQGETEDEDPRWEAEEDFTLEHVWNDPDDDDDANADHDKPKPVGIVYYHTSLTSLQTPTQIHVTLHDEAVEPREGQGNTPMVIEARGHAFLQPPPPSAAPLHEDEDRLLTQKVWEENDGFGGYLAKLMFAAVPPPKFEMGVYRHSVGNASASQSTASLAPSFSSSTYPPSSSSPWITVPFPTPPVSIRRTLSMPITSPCLNLDKRVMVLPDNTPALPVAQRKRSTYLRKRIERSRQRTRSRPKRGTERTALEARVEVDRGSDEEREKVELEVEAKVKEEENPTRKLGEEMQNQGEEDAEGEDENEDDGLMVQSADGTWLTIREAARRIVEEHEV